MRSGRVLDESGESETSPTHPAANNTKGSRSFGDNIDGIVPTAHMMALRWHPTARIVGAQTTTDWACAVNTAGRQALLACRF